MQKSDLIALLSKPPASFTWASSDDDQRTMGTSEGFVLDIWPNRIEAAALFPPDRPDLAGRNGTLLQLILLALRPDWPGASAWLTYWMRAAGRTAKRIDEPNIARRVHFVWDPTQSRATLTVTR